jgi:mRNA interferase RelE/StbE
MPRYTIEIIPKAEKEFLKLLDRVQDSIGKKILLLEENPRPFGSKKLKETEFYRIRIGEFRVIYSIDDPVKLVKILSVAHRREVYR